MQRGERRGGEAVEVGVSVEQAVALDAGEPVTQLSLPVGEGGGEQVPGWFVGGGELAGEGAEWAAQAGGAVGAGVDDAVKAGGQVVPVGDGGELLLGAEDGLQACWVTARMRSCLSLK